MSGKTKIWLQLSYLMQVESDAAAYAYPRPEGWEETMEACRVAGDRFYEKAKELSGGDLPDEAWREAVDGLGRIP